MTSFTHLPRSTGFPTALLAAVLDDALSYTAHRPCILGISGLQGSGKSTLAAQVAGLARERGLQAATLSLDDVYFERSARLLLAERVHPLLANRGPPGSHDLALAHATLDALSEGRAVQLPRFDKLTDDRLPRSQWPWQHQRLDILLLEGWMLGCPAEEDAALAQPINALEREEDGDGLWRRYCNQALARDYPALWKRLDRLWLLLPPDLAQVPRWRWQQQLSLQAQAPQQQAMSATQFGRFMQFFQRGSRQALRTLPAIADHIVHLDPQHRASWPGSPLSR